MVAGAARFGALAWGGGLTRGWVAALPESVQGAAHPSTPARPCVQGSGRAALTFGICAHKSVAEAGGQCAGALSHTTYHTYEHPFPLIPHSLRMGPGRGDRCSDVQTGASRAATGL